MPSRNRSAPDGPAGAPSVGSIATSPSTPATAARLRARLIAWATALSGLLLVLSSLPVFGHRARGVASLVTPFGLRVTSQVASLLIGAALLYLAGQLARRRRMAWVVALVLFGGGFVTVLLRGHRFVPGVLSAIMIVLLVASRKDFRAPGDPPTLGQFFRFVVWYTIGVVVYGMTALYLERDHITPTPTLWRNIDEITSQLVGLSGPYDYQREFFEAAFSWSLFVLGIVGLVWGLVLLFRPIVAHPLAGEDDWAEAVRIVREHSEDTLDYFALRDDKLFFFSSDRTALIAYTYLGRYALAAGDPIGNPAAREQVVDEFIEMCRGRGWGVAFLGALEEDRQMYLDRRLHTVYLGDEAVVRCEGFDLSGKKWKSIRQSSGRVARTYDFVWMAETDAPAALVTDLNDISKRWRGKAPERGFTMTLSADVEGRNPDFRLAIAMGHDGRPGGFLRVVPVYGPEPGYTLDLMRRDPDTPNGMTEFLLTRTVMQLDAEGYDRFSMNFAAWGRFFEESVEYSLPQRAVKLALDAMSPFYQIKSLKEFNQRFKPEWVPRCIVYDDVRNLPRVALLYAAAEGFLTLPVIGRYLLPRTVAHPGHPLGPRIAGRADPVPTRAPKPPCAELTPSRRDTPADAAP